MRYFISYTYEFFGGGHPSFKSIEVYSDEPIECMNDLNKVLKDYQIYENNLTILYWRKFE